MRVDMSSDEALREERARISKRNRQRKWRQRKIKKPGQRIGPSLTIHLNAIEFALLDRIAIEDYEARPSGRGAVRDEIPPCRTRAVRLLIQRYMSAMAINASDLSELMEMKQELGQFWTLETAWRQSSRDSRSEQDFSGAWVKVQPIPPWISDI
jgi:hypothetical protein